MEANRVAKFEVVSSDQFMKDIDGLGLTSKDMEAGFTEEDVMKIYNNLQLPRRATKGSAGYDFFTPFTFTLTPGETIVIPTGIRCNMKEDWVLKCYPRSGLGFKYQANLVNEVAIIDSDFYHSDNEGHIMIKLVNRGNRSFTVEKGKGFAQGIFVQYGITADDDVTEVRNGGFGSTGM